MAHDNVDWHMPFPAKRLLAGKMNSNAICFLTNVDNPKLNEVLLAHCQTIYANQINSKDGFYFVFGAARHMVHLPENVAGYMARKRAWITGLNEIQIDKICKMVDWLEQTQEGEDDPILFEGDVFSVTCNGNVEEELIALWVIKQSYKKPFKYKTDARSSVKTITFSQGR